MLIILYLLGFKLHKNQELEVIQREKEKQITTQEDSLEDDFIFPTDECESVIDNETETYVIGIVSCSFIDISQKEYRLFHQKLHF